MITPPIYSFNLFSPEPLDLEDFDGEDDVIDLRAYHVVGGVYHFNLLHLPPQPKNVNDWVITQVRGVNNSLGNGVVRCFVLVISNPLIQLTIVQFFD